MEKNKGILFLLEESLSLVRAAQELRQSDRDIHSHKNTLVEVSFYPDHEPRKATAAYKKVHKKLIIEEDQPCIICGVRNSILGNSDKNLYKAIAMETHHCTIEWSLTNAIDIQKFNEVLRPRLLKEHPDRDLYKQNMTEKQIQNWIDHDEDNLVVLCDQHHRSKYVGIHAITYPIWGPTNLLKDDFEDYVREQIEKIKNENNND